MATKVINENRLKNSITILESRPVTVSIFADGRKVVTAGSHPARFAIAAKTYDVYATAF